MDLKYIGWKGGVDWTDVAQVGTGGGAVMNAVMNLRVT
jgi:hypothetical protein